MTFEDVPMFDAEPTPNPTPGMFDDVPGLEAPRPVALQRQQAGQPKPLPGPVTVPMFGVNYTLRDQGQAGLTLSVTDIKPIPELCGPPRTPTQPELDRNLVLSMHAEKILSLNPSNLAWYCNGKVLAAHLQIAACDLAEAGELRGYGYCLEPAEETPASPEVKPAPTPQETANAAAKIPGGLHFLHSLRTGYLSQSAEGVWVGKSGKPAPDWMQEVAELLARGGHLGGDTGEPERDLILRHTSENGTMLFGATYGDGAYDALKAISWGRTWRSFRTATDHGFPPGTLYVRHTRDKAPLLGAIDKEAEALRAAGFTVKVEIDGKPRDPKVVLEDRRERLGERADYLTGRAGRRMREADGRAERADDISQRFAMGQPILVGHHSERRARRDQERIHSNMRKSVELAADAERIAERAEGARRSLAHLDSPIKVARWIERAEAEMRGIERGLNGYVRQFRNGKGVVVSRDEFPAATGQRREQLLLEQDHLAAQLEYARERRDAYIAEGKLWGGEVAAINKGDQVLIRGEWMLVEKRNPKTVRVISVYTPTGLTYPHHEIRGHRPAGAQSSGNAEPAATDEQVSGPCALCIEPAVDHPRREEIQLCADHAARTAAV
jgi:hypothetical protein